MSGIEMGDEPCVAGMQGLVSSSMFDDEECSNVRINWALSFDSTPERIERGWNPSLDTDST